MARDTRVELAEEEVEILEEAENGEWENDAGKDREPGPRISFEGQAAHVACSGAQHDESEKPGVDYAVEGEAGAQQGDVLGAAGQGPIQAENHHHEEQVVERVEQHRRTGLVDGL